MQNSILPVWASQAKREEISKLYSSDAMGIQDDSLVNEVAFAMLTRAESIMAVSKLHAENILNCPSCACAIQGDGSCFKCKCGWEISRSELHKTYKRKQLVGGAALPFIEKAIKSFPINGNYSDKMLWIDNLIHAFHGELNEQFEKTELAYRPIARNFIAGSNEQVIELIYNLAYSDNPDFMKNRSEWMDKLKKSYVPDNIKDKFSKV